MVSPLAERGVKTQLHKQVEHDAEGEEDDRREEEEEGDKEPAVSVERETESELAVDAPEKGDHANAERYYAQIAEEVQRALGIFINEPDIDKVDQAADSL